MKSKEKFIRKQILWVFLRTILVTILPSFGLGIAGCGNVDRVEQAYQLRMNGKADQAKTQLEQLIKEDSTNALAFYELARTQYHMALGNPRKIIDGINQAQQSIDQAMKYDPDNVIYTFFAGNVYLMQAYISLMRGQPGCNEKVAQTTAQYEKVLKLKPDYYEAMLYLVELYGIIPEDKGGNKERAQQYAEQLKKEDEVYGAQAMAMLLPEDSDKVAYWKKIVDENKDNAMALERLGKACLYEGKSKRGMKNFEEAVKTDPAKSILFLDLARYHIMSARRDNKLKDSALPAAEKSIERYLESDPCIPLKAYSLGLSAKIKWALGDKKAGDKLLQEAKTVDPFFSKTSGIPSLHLFVPLGKISYNHTYFYRPF